MSNFMSDNPFMFFCLCVLALLILDNLLSNIINWLKK